MADYYFALEREKRQSEEDLKREAMVCNESLQIPGPLGIIHSHSQGFKTFLPADLLQVQHPEFKENPKNPHKTETEPIKRARRERESARKSTTRGLDEMNPYLIVADDPEQGGHQPEDVGEKVKRWMRCEFFYSAIDRPYFEHDELRELIEALDIPYPKLRRADYILIRKSIGKRRRISQHFLNKERQKLHNYREITREVAPYIVMGRNNSRLEQTLYCPEDSGSRKRQ
eukprot:TRINITY_DN10062_c0_g1_i1.p1 TRINITY_DN10062_c0_g1~~TRINITY_DN10062_c0_g1_i1.p1  ORF type:complete len:229 (-),score=60.99 TRINITY_DN10062_c0_g1_i1:604-1290(-)